jgi:hypothetical protein
MDGSQGNDQPLCRVAGGLLHSADLGVGHRQQAGFDATGFEARGGVGEDEGAFLGEAEQRSQSGDHVAVLVSAQRVQRVDVGGGDLTDVVVLRRPSFDERADGSEVSVEGRLRPGTGAGVAVKQHQHPR